MSDLNVRVDELANPNYPKRFSQHFAPDKFYDQIFDLIQKEKWSFKLTHVSGQFYHAEIFVDQLVNEDGTTGGWVHGYAPASGPAALCKAYIEAKEKPNG